MYLASQSPRRRELLEELGFSLRVVPADIDEAHRAGEVPRDLVLRLAEQKAEASRARLAGRADDELLLAADTVVWTGDDALGKPADDADARRMLRELSGRTHHVSTGVCLLRLSCQAQVVAARSFVETCAVTFFDLTDAQIAAYVASGEPRDKAGAYGIQGLGRLLVRGIEGDYFTVVGLPMARLVREMDELLGDDALMVGALGGRGLHG